MTTGMGSLLEPDWLGLVIDNRRLFDALEDGWIRPVPPQTGLPVGVRAFVEETQQQPGNRIPVRVRLDAARLPDLRVHVRRHNEWRSVPRSQILASDQIAYWPGVLPAFAIRDLAVASEENRARLLSMVRRASNLSVPEVLVSDAVKQLDEMIPYPAPVPDELAGLAVPAAEDRVRGAMTMAVWAVPRIDPWMNVLVASLASDVKRLAAAAKVVDASWWRFPPWTESKPSDGMPPECAQERLWLAASEVLGSQMHLRPSEAVDQIAQVALAGSDCPNERRIVERWCRTTRQVLRADVSIRHDEWRQEPVGLAIQLVLARPEPAEFKTWLCDGTTNLSPAVAWSAATLCGLFHGYRRLDTGFRGAATQQEVIAVQALRTCTNDAVPQWPGMTNDAPRWRRESGRFVLTWGGRDFAAKLAKARGQWHAADLDDVAVRREAVVVAKHFNWPCVERVLKLGSGRRSWSGPGMLRGLEGDMDVRGIVELRLLRDDRVVEEVDQRSFLRLMATEPGDVPEPPVSVTRPDVAIEIPGLRLIPGFLTEEQEEAIITEIDRQPWSGELRRRVQHYGWRYDYQSRRVDPSMRIGPLPEWAGRVARSLFDAGHVPQLPDQVIVNEYKGNQGIQPHIDSPSSFDDGVAMVSLLETWQMEFRRRGHKGKGMEKVSLGLERRSAAILTGEARYEWTHGIPQRKTEPGAMEPGRKTPRRVPRGRRISLTFRKVLVDGHGL